jgi:hypothetical protein
MQQPGILQPAEADSQSIGRRRFTELPGRLNFRDRIGRIPNRSQIGIRDLIRSAPGFNKIPPYAVRTRDLSIYYVYGGIDSPLGWGGYGSGPLRSGLCPWRSIPCPVQARHTEPSGQGRKRFRAGGEGVVTRGAAAAI